MARTFDFLSGAFVELADDALFGPEQVSLLPTPRTARVTCRVCLKPCVVDLQAPAKLCDLCREDLDKSAAHVSETQSAALWAAQNAWDRWSADVAHADEATQARYQTFSEAQQRAAQGDAIAQQQVDQVITAVRGGLRGPLAELVRGELTYLEAADRYAETAKWANIALDEIDAQREG